MKIPDSFHCPQPSEIYWQVSLKKQGRKWRWRWKKVKFWPHILTHPQWKKTLILSGGLGLLIGSCIWRVKPGPATVQASTPTLVFNEIYPTPPSGQTEWLEIYNASSETISLEGWRVAELVSSQIKNHEAVLGTQGETSLRPGEFLVMENSKITLNNSGDTIYLFDQNGTLADEVTYGTIKEKSWARAPDGYGEWVLLSTSTPGVSNWSTYLDEYDQSAAGMVFQGLEPLTTLMTATTENQASKVTLQLSEIMACPNTGETEWLEVYNQSSQDWTMNNWKIKNGKSSSRTIKDLKIKADSLNLIEFSSGLLPNSGDTLTLESADGEVILQAEYPTCSIKGTSYIYDGESWVENYRPTPGETNIYQNSDQNQAANDLSWSGENLTTSAAGNGSGGASNDDITNPASLSQSAQSEMVGGADQHRRWSPITYQVANQDQIWASQALHSREATASGTTTSGKKAYDLSQGNSTIKNRWFIFGIGGGIIITLIGGGGFLYQKVKNFAFPSFETASSSNKPDLEASSQVQLGNELAFADLF